MTPAVSICVPVYNMAGFLPDAVESSLGQTWTDLELVIVDNASTDGTYEIATDYARRDSRVRVIRNDTNIGPLKNFNRCFDLANGTWIKWLCADDWLAPDCLERVMAAVRPGPLVVNCAEVFAFPPETPDAVREMHLKYWREHCHRLAERFPGQTMIPAADFAELIAEDPTIHSMTVCSSMVHREGWERFGLFKLDLIQLNDWELNARIGVHTGVLNVEDAVTYYRIHGSSLGDSLVSSQPFQMDVLCPLVLRHDVVYEPHYAPVREAARRRGIDLRFELFDAARHARDSVAQYTAGRGDAGAPAAWDAMVKRYPDLMTAPPGYYATKVWRWAVRRLRSAAPATRLSAGAEQA